MKFRLLLLLAAFGWITAASAQDSQAADTSARPVKRNLLKTNLTSIPFKNYSLQYERVLSKGLSLALTFRVMPTASLPFKNTLLEWADDDDAENLVRNARLGNIAITPEIRFYLGKGYGKGFYIAPYYRYVRFASNEVPVSYTSFGVTKEVNLSGNLSAHTGGLLFGAQWFLGKKLCLDWWILGAHYGAGDGAFNGRPTTPLTPAEQQDIRDELEAIDIPLTEKTVTVTPTNVDVRLNGPFGGLRGGLSLGFRF